MTKKDTTQLAEKIKDRMLADPECPFRDIVKPKMYAFKAVAIIQCQVAAHSLEEAQEKIRAGQFDGWDTGRHAFQLFPKTAREWTKGDVEPTGPNAKPTTSSGGATTRKVLAEQEKMLASNAQVSVEKGATPSDDEVAYSREAERQLAENDSKEV